MLMPVGGGIEGMASGVSDLKGALAEGVTFTEEAADALKSTMRQLQATLREVHADALRLGQELPIGDTPAAKVYKPFLATIATDPDQGLVPQLVKMQRDAQDVLDAIDKSARSTQTTDGDNVTVVKGSYQC